MKDLLKRYLPYCTVVLAIILPWFFHPGYLFFTDLSWGPVKALDWTSVWLILDLITKILSIIFSVAFLEKILIGFSMLIVLIGCRKIAGHFLNDKLAVFVISLFAVFNPFVYDRFMYGQVGIVLAFGFFLLSVGCLFEYLNEREIKVMILFGVYCGLTLMISVHFIFFSGLIFILFLFSYFKKWKLDNWKHFVRNLFIAGAICILLNANWLAADIFGKSDTYNYVSSAISQQDLQAFKTSGFSNAQVLSNVVMMSGFWGKDQHRYADLTTIKSNWGRSFLLLLPIIILGVTLGIKRRETRALFVGFLVTFLISLILAAGIALSFTAPITYWLFDHFPLYKGLRESQKWVSVLVLIYTIFLSMGTASLLKTKIISINRRVFLVFLGVVIIMQTPFILWGFWGQARPTQYPTDWTEVNSILKCQNDEKILFLPWHMYMSFSWIGKVTANPSRSFFTCPVISSSAMEWGGIYDNSQGAEGEKVGAWLQVRGQNELLKNNQFSIRYIVLAKELDWGNYSWLGSSTSLTLFKDTETLRVYKVNQ